MLREARGRLAFRPGLVGSGLAISNTLSVLGQSVPPCNVDTAEVEIVLEELKIVFTRGDANLDGELDETDAAAVAAHFELCRACYPRYQFEQSFLASLREIQQDEKAPPALRDRIVRLLEEEE